MGLYEFLVGLKGVVNNLLSRGARAVALFGSIARGVDFIPCRSDVDLLVVSSEDDYWEDYIPFNDHEVKLSIAYYSPSTLQEMAHKLHPLILHLYKASIIYYDDGVLASILHDMPQKITKYTVDVEKQSTIVALTLALENLSLKHSEEALDHVHHALRHLARAVIGEGKPVTMFPVYDSESLIALEDRSRELGQLFMEVRYERTRCKTSSRVVEKLLRRTWSLVSKHIGLSIPSLEKVLEKCGSNRNMSSVKLPLIVTRKSKSTVTIVCDNVVVEP